MAIQQKALYSLQVKHNRHFSTSDIALKTKKSKKKGKKKSRQIIHKCGITQMKKESVKMLDGAGKHGWCATQTFDSGKFKLS